MKQGYLSELFVSFQGEGLHAGRRQLFVRLSGCHLRCRYCDTPGSLQRTASCRVHASPITEVPNPLTARDTLAHAMSVLESAGAVDGLAITGGEPLLQAEFLAELLADARWPRPRMLETSGTQPDKLASVLPVVDVVSMDIKLPSNTGEPPFWEAHAQFLAAAREKAYVKVLIDADSSMDDVGAAARLVGAHAPAAAVFLQPITNPVGGIDLDGDRLSEIFTTFRRYLADVRVLPQTHKLLGIQ